MTAANPTGQECRTRRGAGAGKVAGVVAGALLALGVVLLPNPCRALDDAIRIETPVDEDPIELTAETLTRSVRGWLFRFPVKVSARGPILGVKVNGEWQNLPHATEVAFDTVVRLRGGTNRIRVTAFTDANDAARVFTIELDAPDPPTLSAIDLADTNIRIERPADDREPVVATESLLRVPGGEALMFEPGERQPVTAGLMFPFAVEVTAPTPIRWIAIDGRIVAHPDATEGRGAALIALGPQSTDVVVEAGTDWGQARRVFPLRLAGHALPGTPFYLKAENSE